MSPEPQAAGPIPPWLGWASFAARLIVGGILIYSGTMKAAGAAEEFAIVISGYQLVPDAMAMSLAAMLPWLELLAGYALALGYFARQAAMGALALLASFFLALLSTRARGIELPNCGCFGAGLHMPPSATMAMDAGLLLLAWLALRAGEEKFSLDRWAKRGL